MYHFRIIALALLLTGCSALTNKFIEQDPLLIPPNVLSEDGYLADKLIGEKNEL